MLPLIISLRPSHLFNLQGNYKHCFKIHTLDSNDYDLSNNNLSNEALFDGINGCYILPDGNGKYIQKSSEFSQYIPTLHGRLQTFLSKYLQPQYNQCVPISIVTSPDITSPRSQHWMFIDSKKMQQTQFMTIFLM